VARLARQFVTVALTGDGGDEGFGGYSTFWAYYHASRLRSVLPSASLSPLAVLAEGLRQTAGPFRRAGTLLRLASNPVEDTFAGGNWIRRADRDALFTDAMREKLGSHDSAGHYQRALACDNGAGIVDRVMQAHMLTTLPDDYLAKADAASMAVGVEARSPFLDQELIELAMRIPAKMRFSGGTPKALLRHLAYRYLPRQTIDRRKQGFVAPVGRWLREDWQDLVQGVILGPEIERRGFFKRSALERVVAQHREGYDFGYLLWTLLMLELWMRMAVDRVSDAYDERQPRP